MSDTFRNIFDVSDLDEHEIGHLEFVLNSPSYDRVFKPYLERLRNGLNQRLLDPSSKRKDEYPDDFLRGCINVVDGQLTFFAKLIAETQVERVNRARGQMTDEDKYTAMRLDGRMRPAGQSAEPAPPSPDVYRPEEDF